MEDITLAEKGPHPFLPTRAILREPLVHFLLLATLLFGADHYWSANHKEKIIVDQQTAEFLVKQREDIVLRELLPEERREVIESYVEDEILYREAYKRGMDKADSRMRRNMILKMRGLLVGDVGKPTEAQLRAFFADNTDRYRRLATVTVEHFYYADPAQVPEGVLEQLQVAANPAFGEVLFGYDNVLRDLSTRDLSGIFGPDTARQILELGDNDWHGPFDFPRGVVFVRVVDRQAEQPARSEYVWQYIADDWRLAKSRQAIEAEVERLSDQYDVQIDAAGL